MMKKYFLKTILLIILCGTNSFAQTIIAQWNFNGSSATTIPGGTAAPTPSIGIGTAELVGTTATFAAGNITAGTLEIDTAVTAHNFAWNTSGYALVSTENKQRGVQFNVSTVNQTGITFRFEQRLSNSTNTTYVTQYTTNRMATTPIWIDAQTFTFTPTPTSGDTWYNARSVDLSAVAALNNNANVAFRVVSAFDNFTNDYLASNSTKNHAAIGTVRFEMVTLSSSGSLANEKFGSNRNEFRIYPNPSNKELVYLNQMNDVQVFDILGKQVFYGNNITSIDTSDFQSGIYFVKTKSGITRKLVVR